MSVASKAGIMLALTFVLGGVVGALAYGAVINERPRAPHGPPPGLGGPPGQPGNRPPSFVDRTLDLLQPHDPAQADSLRPFLEETDRRNRTIVDSARGQMHDELRVLRDHIAPLLDAEQLRRFDDFASR